MINLLDIDTRVTSRVNNKVKSKLKKTYPELVVTDTDRNNQTKTYPFVYVHELEGSEVGQTLDNSEINARTCNFEIKVYSDKSQDVNKEVMIEVVGAMKSMLFNVVGTPYNANENGLYIRICRFNRIVASGDTL